MERCHSNTSLPQDFQKSAKYNLVNLARSDGETNVISQDGCLYTGDYDFKSKRRKPNTLSKSIQELCFKGDGVMAPSTANTTKRKITRVPSQDDLWKSIQTNYTFLMADDLIAECQETRKELYLPPLPLLSSPPSKECFQPHHMLTFTEFLDRFNMVHDTLHSLQTSTALSELSETHHHQVRSECLYLKEQAALLKLMNPELKDDINRRCNILANKLNLLERLLFPKRVYEKDKTFKRLTAQMKEIRKWLQEVEGKLRNLKINDNCETEEMNEVFTLEKILQREIEGRGKELTSIVRQCDSLEGATVAESKRLRRAAAHLERSWHNIWIRSLEKQCLTEQRLLERQSYENNHKEGSDFELDEGPLNKHRRLTLDRWTAVATAASMDRLRHDRDTRRTNDVIKRSPTKDVGVLCSDLIPVNDKCIMVGTTGIAALKAEYGDDFTNFEIIQDVGYSSESSTHLSSDDGISVGRDRYFNIRVYNYHDGNKTAGKCVSLKEELENADPKQLQSLASSLGSSSGATSFNDSGLGASDLLSYTGNSSEVSGDQPLFSGLRDICENAMRDAYGEESDFLDTVLQGCGDFCVSEGEKDAKELNETEDLQYCLSGIESDDSVDNFHNRSSFTTSSQLFYKMISVDSDNEADASVIENTLASNTTPSKSEFSTGSDNPIDISHLSTTPAENFTASNELFHQENKSDDSDFNGNTLKPSIDLGSVTNPRNYSCPKSKANTSSAKESNDRRPTASNGTPNLKRKRDSDSTDFATIWQGGGRVPHRVRTWLKRSSHYTDTASLSRVKRCLFPSGSGHSSCDESVQNPRAFNISEDLSSCDASGEYTSSSADEGNALSYSPTTFFHNDHVKERLDSCSVEGSVETVIRGLNTHHRPGVDWMEVPPLLPPPLSSTPACLRSGQCKTNSMRCCNNCDYPLSRHSCGDIRWLVIRASSEGDLRTRVASEHSLTNIPSDKRHKKPIFVNSTFDYKNGLSSSLPSVLRYRSDGSAEDIKGSVLSHSSRRFNQHEESLTSVVSHNQSSSSDFEKRKKRRSRRKSSSSNQSSRSVLTSGDSSRHRSRTLTSSINGSRRRHFSQRSDFFEGSENNLLSEGEGSLSEVNKAPKEEINHKTLKDELELALEDGCRNSAALLSPAESDVILTQLEEQSTVSDQVWDNYQDMPYLSEAYSEATVDEDAVRKLTEFGDDYGSAIGQPLRYLDATDGSNNKPDITKSPSKKSSKAFQVPVQSNDSDSDLEDFHHVIEEAEKALQFARSTLKRRQSGDFFSSTENAELLATCGTHLHWLQTICEHIEIDGNESNFSTNDLKELHSLIQEWEDLKKSIEMYEEVDDPISQRYIKSQKNIDALFSKLSELSAITDMETNNFESWEELQEKIANLQMIMSTLQDTKELLLAVNLQVHRFMTEHGSVQEYRDCSLKGDVTELYQRWEDVYEKQRKKLAQLSFISLLLDRLIFPGSLGKQNEIRTNIQQTKTASNNQNDKDLNEFDLTNVFRNGTQLTKLEILSSRWTTYYGKVRTLRLKLNEAQTLSSYKDCDKIGFSSEEEFSEYLQKELKELKCNAEFLRSSSMSAASSESIKMDLRDLEKRIKRQTRTLSVSRNADHPNSSSVEDDPDDHFEDAIQQMKNDDYDSMHNKRFTTHHSDPTKKDAIGAKKRSSKFWRIVRIAVPVQLTLVLLFCLACYLEPNCCDRLNNFGFSLTPHLRYLRGPPPV